MTQTVKFDIDNDFKRVGEFGLYQIIIFVLVGLTAFIPAIIVYGYSFASGTPQFRCKISSIDNDTYELHGAEHESIVNQYIPIKSTNPIVYDKCHIKVYENENTLNKSTNKYSIKKCDSWVFSDKVYKKTIATDWELVCDKATKKSTFSSVFFFGSYGVIFVGIVSDKFGRKTCAYILVVLNAILISIIALVVNIDMNQTLREVIYTIARTFIGTTGNIYSIAVVLAIEVCGPSYRVAASNVIYYFYILGEYITVLLCYFVRDYSVYYIWLAGIFSVFPLYFWLLPESPRWLLVKNRDAEAYTIFKRIAWFNRKPLHDTYETFVLEKTKELKNDILAYDEMETNAEVIPIGFFQTLYTFVKSKKLLLRTIAVAFNWLTNNLVYYGITLGAGQLAGDPYLNVALLATTEFVAIVCSQFAFQKIGRKIPYIVNMIITGVVLLVVYFVPKSIGFLVTIIALIGKFTISFTFGGVYIVTSELYPTLIRQTTLSLCQIVGKIGAIISPYINLLGEVYFEPLPFMIYGASAIIASILTFFFIPETKNRPLPNSIDDIDE